MDTYPNPIWKLLEQLEPAGLHGLPIEDLPADVLRAAELAGLVRVFNEWPGPKQVYVVSADAPRDRSYIPPRPMPDPVRMVGMTPPGREALTARRRDAALAALGGQKLTSAEPTAEQTETKQRTQAETDDAIRDYALQHASNLNRIEKRIAAGDAKAGNEARKLFGRNALAKRLGLSAGAVSNSQPWKAVAARLKLQGRKPGVSRSDRIGLDVADEKAAERLYRDAKRA